MDSEKIVHDVAERVRAIVTEAEERAAEIVRDAEAEAKRIRERAETEGKERLEEVRKALDELQGKLGAGGAAAKAPEAEVEPGPVVVPEPEPPAVPEPEPPPAPEPAPEPEPPLIPEPAPPPDEGTPPAVGNGAKSDDAAGARLVAMNMALDGASSEQIAAKLSEDYELEDADGLITEVLARAGK